MEKYSHCSRLNESKIMRIDSAKAIELEDSSSTSPNMDAELKDIINYLSSGVFYFSKECNIALNNQFYNENNLEKSNERLETFIWNGHLLEPVIDLANQLPSDQNEFLTSSGIFSKIVKGFFGSLNKNINGNEYFVAIHSRIGRKKAGTRYNSRGLDDEGNVSIFCETEIIISNSLFAFSYIILRGSVPVFWEQQGVQIGPPNIQITRAPLATQPSFDRHFENLIENYGMIHVVNLLSSREGSSELLLTDAYEYHSNNSYHSEKISFSSFDLNKILQKK